MRFGRRQDVREGGQSCALFWFIGERLQYVLHHTVPPKGRGAGVAFSMRAFFGLGDDEYADAIQYIDC